MSLVNICTEKSSIPEIQAFNNVGIILLHDPFLAFIASVSVANFDVLAARKLGREQKKERGGGGGQKRKRLKPNPWNLKNPFSPIKKNI